MAPARQRVLVDHRVLQDGVGGQDQRGHVEPVEVPVGEGGQEVLEAPGAAPVAHRGLGRVDLGDPVHELAALVVDVVADRVDHHLADGEPARAHHAAAREKGLPGRGASPHVDARIARRALVRIQLLAQRRVDAVAAHRDRAAHRRAAIGEVHRHAVGILFDAGAAVAALHAVGAQALQGFVQQHRLQVAAVDRVLRPVVARVLAGGLAEHQLAVLGEEDRLLRAHAHGVERVEQAQLGQLAHRMGSRLMPTPSGRSSGTASYTRQAMPAWCRLRARVRPPMPAPRMMTSLGAVLMGSVLRPQTRHMGNLDVIWIYHESL